MDVLNIDLDIGRIRDRLAMIVPAWTALPCIR